MRHPVMSPREFNESLYLEHMQEIAELARLRARWSSAGGRAIGLDDMIEAHLDGLVLGSAEAIRVARAASWPTAAWSIYGCIALAGRLDRLDVINEVLADVESCCASEDDDVDPELLHAVITEAVDRYVPEAPGAILASHLRGIRPATVQSGPYLEILLAGVPEVSLGMGAR